MNNNYLIFFVLVVCGMMIGYSVSQIKTAEDLQELEVKHIIELDKISNICQYEYNTKFKITELKDRYVFEVKDE